MQDRRIALQQRHDECLAILLIAGGQHQLRLELNERALEHPRFVVEPAAQETHSRSLRSRARAS